MGLAPDRLVNAVRGLAVVPTQRAAVLVGLAAPLALVAGVLAPGAWLVAPALALAMVALVLADAVLAGPLGPVRVSAPDSGEIGEAAVVRVSAELGGGWTDGVRAAFGLDPRLAAEGRLDLPLQREDGAWRGMAALVPTRRGPGRIGRLWLRWTGPLGLGARQHSRALDLPLDVSPSLAVARSPALRQFLRDSELGTIARRIRGEGSQFEALAEYQPGMDRRRIDWKTSARHTHLYAREYEAERNNPIVFAFDCGRAMCEPVAGLPRIDRAISAGLAAAWVALKSGDRAAFFGFAARPLAATPFVAGTHGFARLRRAAAGLDYRAEEPNFTLALATLAERLQRRSLVVVFSEFTDAASAELLLEGVGRLVARHRVLFVTLADAELEGLANAAPADMARLAEAVGAGALLRERALVLARLRQLGVDVIEAPHEAVGLRLIDAYLALRAKGAIG
jgi:uncharacterized protein (DUF58 family)